MKPILNRQYELYRKDDKIFCDSLQVADTFNRQHKHIIRTIQSLTEPTSGLSDEFRKDNFVKSTYTDSSGKRNPKYLLTKDGFVMVTMEFKTAAARRFKEEYIKRFNDMSRHIDAMQDVKSDYPELMEAVMLAHPQAQSYHYVNEINMLYSVVLGQSVRSYCKLCNIKGSVRDYLTTEQLHWLKKLQRADIGLLLTVSDMRQRKEILSKLKM